MQEVLTRLSNACERGDPRAVEGLFVEHAVLETVCCPGDEDPELLLALSGAEEIGRALASRSNRSPPLWSHLSTHDYIVESLGDFGRVEAQFLRMGMGTVEDPAAEPTRTSPALEALEAGSYHADLRRTPEGWKIWRLRISRNWPLPDRVNFADKRR